MKKNKGKIIYLLMSCEMLLMSIYVNCNLIIAENIELPAQQKVEEVNTSSVITEKLYEYIQKSRSNYIPVTIQINDNVNLEEIEKKAFENNNITQEQLKQLEEYSYTLSEEEIVSFQKKMLVIYDNIRDERNRLLKEHYNRVNNDFVKKMKWTESDYSSMGIFTPFVRNVNLSVEEIYDLADSGMVSTIDYYQNSDYITENIQNVVAYEKSIIPSVNDTVSIINGNVALENGYRGSGVKVGVIETGAPNASYMMGDAKYIYRINCTSLEQLTNHATIVCGIIKKMAPDCSIYSYCSGDEETTIEACEYLIDTYNVHVINLSTGDASYNGAINAYSLELDTIIRNNKVAIVAAAGNAYVYNNNILDDWDVSNFAIAPDVISVGAVSSSGSSQTVNGAYEFGDVSCYVETLGSVNKPEICAPGKVQIYSLIGGYDAYTSYSTPHITGTIVQMISVNSSMSLEPTALKAALLSSAKYGTTTRGNDLVSDTYIDNKEGAGVVDAGFCYNVAKAGKKVSYDMPYSQSTWSFNILSYTTSIPLRLSCVWETYPIIGYGSVYNDFDVYIYKNGQCIESACIRNHGELSKNTNYEIIELDTTQLSETGYYEVRIERFGYPQSSGWNTISLAWEQS